MAMADGMRSGLERMGEKEKPADFLKRQKCSIFADAYQNRRQGGGTSWRSPLASKKVGREFMLLL